MKKLNLSLIAILAISTFAIAGGDIDPVEPVVETKKAALGPNRSSIAGRLPILFDPSLAGFLSKVNALGRAPAC